VAVMPPARARRHRAARKAVRRVSARSAARGAAAAAAQRGGARCARRAAVGCRRWRSSEGARRSAPEGRLDTEAGGVAPLEAVRHGRAPGLARAQRVCARGARPGGRSRGGALARLPGRAHTGSRRA
jgi:hypothetical protein